MSALERNIHMEYLRFVMTSNEMECFHIFGIFIVHNHFRLVVVVIYRSSIAAVAVTQKKYRKHAVVYSFY